MKAKLRTRFDYPEYKPKPLIIEETLRAAKAGEKPGQLPLEGGDQLNFTNGLIPSTNNIVILPISSANIPRKLIDISQRKKKVSKFAQASSHYKNPLPTTERSQGFHISSKDLYCDYQPVPINEWENTANNVRIVMEKCYGGEIVNDHYDELLVTHEEYMATSQYLDNGFADPEVIVNPNIGLPPFSRFLSRFRTRKK